MESAVEEQVEAVVPSTDLFPSEENENGSPMGEASSIDNIDHESIQDNERRVAVSCVLDAVEDIIVASVDVNDDHPSFDDDTMVLGKAEHVDDDDDCNTRDTLPMYDNDPTTEASCDKDDSLIKDESVERSTASDDVVDEESQPGKEASASLTFPHCFICGFDRPTKFIREKKAPRGPHRGRVLFRNKCVRKPCSRYFGPSYLYDVKTNTYEIAMEENGTGARPYASGPREEKFPDIDYERAKELATVPSRQSFQSGHSQKRRAASASTSSMVTVAERDGTASPVINQGKKTRSSTSSTSTPTSTSTTTSTVIAVVPPKKLRKGYQWVIEEVQPSTSTAPTFAVEGATTMDTEKLNAAVTGSSTSSSSSIPPPSIILRSNGTQTGDDDHLQQFAIDEMRTKASFALLKPDESVPLSSEISSRLFLSHKMIAQQMKEIKKLREEKNKLQETLAKSIGLISTFRKDSMNDMHRLKDDVECSKKELKNFAHDMHTEAMKDLKEIKRLKEECANRVDESDGVMRRVQATLEHQRKMTEMAELNASHYHRLSVELDNKVTKARLAADEANTKLNDKLFLKDKARCTHCQINEKMRIILTEKVAEKTHSADQLGKEREKLQRKADNFERINAIVSKENARLKFELRAWEANCHRMKAEMQSLKGANGSAPVSIGSLSNGLVTVPPSGPNPTVSIGEAAFTPSSVKESSSSSSGMSERVVAVGPEEDPPLCDPYADEPIASVASAASIEEGEYKSPIDIENLHKLPPPPPQPTIKEPSPEMDNPFANWVPKGRPAEPEIPPEMLAAMAKVEESMRRGPPPQSKKEKERGGGGDKGKRSAGGPHGHPAKGVDASKKPKLEKGMQRADKKDAGAPVPPRPISTIGKAPPPAGALQKLNTAAANHREEPPVKSEPSTVPFTSAHEPAFPAAVVAKKPVKVVPYNGIVRTTDASPAKAPQPSRAEIDKKSIPLSISRDRLASAIDALTASTKAGYWERERERQRLQQRAVPLPIHRQEYYDAPRIPPMHPTPASSSSSRFEDADLPWNAPSVRQRQPSPQYMPSRSRTPTQDWYYDAGDAAPPPARFYDDPYDRRPPAALPPARNDYDYDYGGHPQPLLGPPRQLPPPSGYTNGGHLPPSAHSPQSSTDWRREWHEPMWSNERPPEGPPRGYY